MLKKLIPHVCIIISLLMITFFILDMFNPGMNFVGNDIFKILLVIYGVVTLITSGSLIAYNTKQKKGQK
jgi:uncharacterized membrane protein